MTLFIVHTPAPYDKIGRPIMTIGIYNEHAFLITDISTKSQTTTLAVIVGVVSPTLPT